jgi:hypothetical protein
MTWLQYSFKSKRKTILNIVWKKSLKMNLMSSITFRFLPSFPFPLRITTTKFDLFSYSNHLPSPSRYANFRNQILNIIHSGFIFILNEKIYIYTIQHCSLCFIYINKSTREKERERKFNLHFQHRSYHLHLHHQQ